MKASIISIGNEILLGKTINTNLAFLGNELSKAGIEIVRAYTIKDDRKEIIATLKLVENDELVICTGGLGPTKDDITKKVVAEFFSKKMVFHENIWQKITENFKSRGVEIPAINHNQAEVPEDFLVLDNRYGTAPGLFYELNNSLFFFLPGVPYEMKSLFTNCILPILIEKKAVSEYYLCTIHTYDLAESRIAEILDDLEISEDVNLAYLPQAGRVDLRIYGHNTLKCQQLQEIIETRLSQHIWGYADDNIVQQFHNYMIKNNKTFSVAESCTGGLIQKLITDISGASQYFSGGIVSYSNRVKQSILGVDNDLLEQFGAVSEEVAKAMVIGTKKLFNSDIAAAVTGIAGPDGGSMEKPVGTVHIAIIINEKLLVKKTFLIGDRTTIRLKAAEKVFFLIIEELRKLGKIETF